MSDPIGHEAPHAVFESWNKQPNKHLIAFD